MHNCVTVYCYTVIKAMGIFSLFQNILYCTTVVESDTADDRVRLYFPYDSWLHNGLDWFPNFSAYWNHRRSLSKWQFWAFPTEVWLQSVWEGPAAGMCLCCMFCSEGGGLRATVSKTHGVGQHFPNVGGHPFTSHEINLVDVEKPFKKWNRREETRSEGPWGEGQWS